MAANMQQMAAGQMMGQQRRPQPEWGNQISRIVMTSLQGQGPQPTSGWQSTVSMQDRMGKTTALITNMILALPGQEWRGMIANGIDFERKLFTECPDRATYERMLSNRIAELVTRRQANDPNLRNDLNNQQQAAQQAAAIQQQQQLMMNRNQFSGMPTPQPGLQHLQHQMQASPIPPQQTQPMGFNMSNAGMPMGMSNPQMGQMGMPGQGRPNMAGDVMSRLSDQDKAKVAEAAVKLAASADTQTKQGALMQLQAQYGPNFIQSMRAQGKDPLSFYFQRHAFNLLSKSAQMNNKNMQPGMPGLPPNANPASIVMLQQQQQQQQQQRAAAAQAAMNQGMLNNMGQPQGAPFAPFTDMNSIMNGQKEGLMAEQSGQMVVPASSQPGPRTTPQPMPGMPGHGMPNGQQPQTPGQRPPGMPPQAGMFNPSQVQPANGQNQAAIRAAAQQQVNQFQKQGLGGAAAGSQGPGMNTLNAPMQQPMPMGGMDGQRPPQGPMAFPTGMDPRFNQRPNMMSGDMNTQQQTQNFLRQMTPEQRARLAQLPPERLQELMAKWAQTRGIAEQGMPPMSQAMRPGQLPQAAMVGMNPSANQLGMATGLPQQPNPQLQQQQGLPQGQQPPQPQMPMNVQQQVRQLAAQVGMNPQQQQQMMDNMDLPQQVSNSFHLPEHVKKWKDFKMWAQTQPGALNEQNKVGLGNMQATQFRMHLQQRRNQMAQQAQAQAQAQMQPQVQPQQPQNQPQTQIPPSAPVQGQMPGQPRPMPQQVPQMPGANPGQPQNVAAGMPQIPQHLQVTPQEIATVRAKHPQLANSPDEQIRKMLMKMKHDTAMRNLAAAQQLQKNAQAPPQQPPAAPGPQAAPMKPEAPVTTAPSRPAVTAPASAPAPAPTATAVKTEPAPAAPNRARPPPTPTMSANAGRKRPVPDEAQESAAKPVAGAQSGPAAQGAPPQQNPPRLPGNMTPEQFAKFTPEQQKKILMHAQAAGQNMTPETKELLNRLKLIGAEEDKVLKTQTWPEIHMSPEDKAATDKKLADAMTAMRAAGKNLVAFYQTTKDELRCRMFFRYRYRLTQQFVEPAESNVPKPLFTVTGSELEQMKMALTQLVTEAEAGKEKRNQAAGQRAGAAAAPGAAPPMQQRPSQQQAQPAPLNEANLEENNRAHNKMHNRSNSKSAQGAPAAPTSTQPPFPIHAASPHGQPAYAGKAQVTQDSLHLPNKRRKTNPMPPGGQSAQPTPPAAQAQKVASPTATRQPAPAPPKPLLQCPEPDCETQSGGFATEEARKAHIEEEHTKPYMDPLAFFQNNLSSSLGLDASGHPLPMQAQPAAPMAAPMDPTSSKQGQTPINKPEPAGVTMSRAASMNRTASGGAVKAEMATPGKMTPAAKAGATPKLGELKTPVPSLDVEPAAAPTANNMWDMSFIDPQDLSAVFNMGGESAADGAIRDFNIYRNAFTPNDTPESSKDSGSSEPNSDISEGAHLDIDLNVWGADENLLMEEMTKISMRPFDDLEGADMAQALMADPSSMIDWDAGNNMTSFYEKTNIELDPSLYFFDTLG